ncbi:hypothetical protein GMRT_12735 [Giardia muris]|uniref:Uncharacterized protein n=1 Tax=Giardia muris TaxID=5742 RepID=A0A4Z1T7V3_GIAMU|nr:hypothetical protein GMRT_12735 [Giardia muris]|eukprot:TNJ28571.1 hypothetical protein GMRT_12735 [Giardia muris]
MLASITATVVDVQLGDWHTATHCELLLWLERGKDLERVAIAPALLLKVVTPIRRKGGITLNPNTCILQIPLLNPVGDYSLRTQVRLAIAKNACYSVIYQTAYTFSAQTFATLQSGMEAKERIELGNSTRYLQFSLRPTKVHGDTTSIEALRFDQFRVRLLNFRLPYSGESFLTSSSLGVRFLTEGVAAEYKLEELFSDEESVYCGTKTALPIYLPYVPHLYIQIVRYISLGIGESWFSFEQRYFGSPPSAETVDTETFVETIPLYQVSLELEREHFEGHAHGSHISFDIPSQLMAADFVGLMDVLYRITMPATFSRVRNVNEVVHGLRGALPQGHLYNTCLKSVVQTNEPHNYFNKLQKKPTLEEEGERIKRYDGVLRLLGLTDQQLLEYGKDWATLALPAEPKPGSSVRFSFVFHPLLSPFEPFAEIACRRNEVGPVYWEEAPGSCEIFEACNMASRGRNMICDISTGKTTQDSCLAILPMFVQNPPQDNHGLLFCAYFAGYEQTHPPTLSELTALVALPRDLSRRTRDRMDRVTFYFILTKNTSQVHPGIFGVLLDESAASTVVATLTSPADVESFVYPQFQALAPQLVPIPDSVLAFLDFNERLAALSCRVFFFTVYDACKIHVVATGSLQMKGTLVTLAEAAIAHTDAKATLKLVASTNYGMDLDSAQLLFSCFGFLSTPPKDGELTPKPNNVRHVAGNSISIARMYSPGPLYSGTPSDRHSSVPPNRTVETPNLLNPPSRPISSLLGERVSIVTDVIPLLGESMELPNLADARVEDLNQSVLLQLIHKLRLELEAVRPKQISYSSMINPTLFENLDTLLPPSVRTRVSKCTGVSFGRSTTVRSACERLQGVDHNVLSYLLIDMIKHNIQLTDELEQANERVEAGQKKLGHAQEQLQAQHQTLESVKTLALEQEQVLQLMERQQQRHDLDMQRLQGELEAANRENVQLLENIRTMARLSPGMAPPKPKPLNSIRASLAEGFGSDDPSPLNSVRGGAKCIPPLRRPARDVAHDALGILDQEIARLEGKK